MDSPARRRLLRLGLLGAAGLILPARLRANTLAQRGLDQFAAAPPCTIEDVTPAVAAGPDYKANAPVRASLVEPGAAGAAMVLSGFVTGVKCGRIKDARLEFWQADAKGAYDTTGFRLRGQQTSDANGKYRLETVLPGAPAGRARHLCARVTPPGRPALVTEIFFPGDPGNARDPRVQPKLVAKAGETGAVKTFTFDFVFDL